MGNVNVRPGPELAAYEIFHDQTEPAICVLNFIVMTLLPVFWFADCRQNISMLYKRIKMPDDDGERSFTIMFNMKLGSVLGLVGLTLYWAVRCWRIYIANERCRQLQRESSFVQSEELRILRMKMLDRVNHLFKEQVFKPRGLSVAVRDELKVWLPKSQLNLCQLDQTREKHSKDGDISGEAENKDVGRQKNERSSTVSPDRSTVKVNKSSASKQPRSRTVPPKKCAGPVSRSVRDEPSGSKCTITSSRRTTVLPKSSVSVGSRKASPWTENKRSARIASDEPSNESKVRVQQYYQKKKTASADIAPLLNPNFCFQKS